MIAPGTILQERYRIERLLGRGGMGAVYEATDLRLEQPVALKETRLQEGVPRHTLAREARLLALLNHPVLPGVTDQFMDGDGQFLVMRYVAGEDLGRHLAEGGGPFPVGEVLTWADQLLDALEYLHAFDPPIVHRDIKPQNLKVNADGDIVLLDFGLARGGDSGGVHVTTQGGTLFGYTAQYAPLEQMRGPGSDPRVDLYALGATLYHLITGVEPPDALTRASAVLDGQPDPLRPANGVNPAVPQAVSDVLTWAMSQNPSARPSSATALRSALREAHMPVPARLEERLNQHPGATGPRTATFPSAVPAVASAAPRDAMVDATTEWDEAEQPVAPSQGARIIVPLLVVVSLLFGLLLSGALWIDLRAADQSPTLSSPLASVPGVEESSPTATSTPTGEAVAVGPATPGEGKATEVSATASATDITVETASPSPTTQFALPSPTASTTGAASATARPSATAAPTETTPPSPTTTPVPPTPTPTVTVTSSPAPVVCLVEPSALFETAWASHRELVGCPEMPAQTIAQSSEQAFEGGGMFWRQDLDLVIVVYDRDRTTGDPRQRATWQSDPTWKWDGSFPEGTGLTPPPGRQEPIRGFGYVWRNFLGAQDGDLGWALDQEYGRTNNAVVQRFERGLMLKASAPTIYLLLDGGILLRE